jgi:hypothetical protein
MSTPVGFPGGRSVLGVLALAMTSIGTAHADYVYAFVNYPSISPGLSACTSINEPFILGCQNPLAQPTSVSYGNVVAASTDFGIDKVYATGPGSGTGAATSQWLVHFGLGGAPSGTQVDLTLTMNYDVFISAGSNNSESGFEMYPGANTLAAFLIRTTTDGLGDTCSDRPGFTAQGACSGMHQGSWSWVIPATVGSDNILTFTADAGVYGTGLVDAYHTATVQSIVVPDGITWSYPNLGGNPLNFESESTTVPEPSALGELGLGIILIGVVRRRMRSRSQMSSSDLA